jgi:hypothetical protein
MALISFRGYTVVRTPATSAHTFSAALQSVARLFSLSPLWLIRAAQIAQSILPINKSTLIYGSNDAWSAFLLLLFGYEKRK